MPNLSRYIDGQLTTPLIISDEESRERQISDGLDTRINQTKNALAQLDATSNVLLTGAQIKTVLRLLLVVTLGILRIMQRRFEAIEE